MGIMFHFCFREVSEQLGRRSFGREVLLIYMSLTDINGVDKK